MCHVIHMDESCRTYGWVMSHIWISYITHMEQSWHTECWIFEWSAGCMSMRQVTHVNESCDTLESVTSHILISHVIQTESCHMTCGIGDCLDVCVLCVSCVLDVHVHRCLFVVASWYVSCLFPSLLLSLCLSPPPPSCGCGIRRNIEEWLKNIVRLGLVFRFWCFQIFVGIFPHCYGRLFRLSLSCFQIVIDIPPSSSSIAKAYNCARARMCWCEMQHASYALHSYSIMVHSCTHILIIILYTHMGWLRLVEPIKL